MRRDGRSENESPILLWRLIMPLPIGDWVWALEAWVDPWRPSNNGIDSMAPY